jgi:hypothetical protein
MHTVRFVLATVSGSTSKRFVDLLKPDATDALYLVELLVLADDRGYPGFIHGCQMDCIGRLDLTLSSTEVGRFMLPL